MRIAIVTKAVETHSGSRVEIELAKQLAKNGQEVSVFGYQELSKKEVKKDLEKHDVKVFLIKSPKIKIIGSFLGGLKLARKLREEKPDIISSHTTIPFLLGAKLSGIPIVATYYGTQLDVWYDKIFPKAPNSSIDWLINNFLNRLIKLNMWLQMAIPNYVVTQTSYCSLELKRFYGKKAPFIFWGARHTTFPKIRFIKKNDNEIHLLSVSRFIPYKGFHLLLEVVKDLNKKFDNLKVTFVGSHPNKKYLNYLKKRKPKNVEVIQDATDKELAILYQKSDIYLTGDKFLFFGVPIFEAASFNIPTIALDYASAKEVTKNGKTGFIVKNKNGFKKALEKLIKNQNLRTSFGENAQKMVQNYSWEKCAQDYLKLFEKLIKWEKNDYSKSYFEIRNYLDLLTAQPVKIFAEERKLRKILDVGCGTGKLVKYLNNNGFLASGCDISNEAIKLAQKNAGEKFIKKASAASLSYKNNSFDLITSISVIEHLTKNETNSFIKESQRVLKEEGFLFLVTPNLSSPARFIRGKKWFGYSDPTHIQFFTPKTLSKQLKKAGFENIKFRTKINYKINSYKYLPAPFKKLPNFLKDFLNFSINYLLISSPFSTLRDSFFLIAQKPNKKASTENTIIALETGHVSSSYLAGGDRILEKMVPYLPKNLRIKVILPAIGTKHWKEAKLANLELLTLPKTIFDANLNPIWIFNAYLVRIWFAFKKLSKIRPDKFTIYSSTNVLPDIAPAFFYKILHPKIFWITRVHHLIESPAIRPGNLIINLASYFLDSISKFMIKSKADLIIALNPALKKELSFQKLPKDKIAVLGAGVDLKKINRVKANEKIFEAIFVGRLHPSKGIFDLVDIWSKVVLKIPRAKLAIVGSGNKKEEGRLKSKIVNSKLNQNIKILGYLTEDELYKTLKSSKILLFSDHEAGWGLAIGEAMAAGLPIVGYNLEIFGSVFTKGYKTVQLGNTKQFAKTVVNLLKDQKDFQRLKKEALLQGKELSWSKTTKEFIKILKL